MRCTSFFVNNINNIQHPHLNPRQFPRRTPPLRQCPRLRTHNLALTIRPKVRTHTNQIVQSRVGALVDQQRTQRRQRVYHQTRLNRSMESGAG
jgi:hypothetical protein